jgi:uncharacterized protein (DUF302 family)
MSKRLAKLFEIVLMLGAIGSAILIGHRANAVEEGIIKVRSAYSMSDTVARIKGDVAKKGIMFFDEIDQQKLAAGAGITLRPSTRLIFGNPALGSNFMTSNPVSGIDWPVRLLVLEDENSQVWAVYNDFEFIAHRHGIANRMKEFKMASEVVASITSILK